MSSILTKMLAQLSDDDKQAFEELSHRLKLVNGDISQLSPDDIKIIQSMENKYGESISQVNKEQVKPNLNEGILASGFAQHVRQIIARDLGSKFPLEEDAVAFVFDNKWLPVDCQNNDLSNDLYEKYKLDIDEVNQWRKDLGDVAKDNKMALGLAWFMVVFQLNKRLSES
jgi:hypothetical protein